MAPDEAVMLQERLAAIPTPAYVADEAQLNANLAKLAAVKRATGAEILYAVKACPLYPLFKPISEVLDGSTASGLYEARLGMDGFGKQVHVYCPAYTRCEIEDLLALGAPLHVYFNSIDQLRQFGPMMRASGAHHLGLRINPALSLTALPHYDPCRRGSHLGVPLEQLNDVPWELVDTLHAHSLCENLAAESAMFIDHLADKLAPWLPQVRAMNFGGGHYITHPDYDSTLLIAALNRFGARYPQVSRVLEPGAAVVYDAGYLLGSVLGVIENEGVRTAILDISANCHIPDVIKTGVTMRIVGAAAPGLLGHDYTLAARTCMARDVWGSYSFARPLKEGDRIIVADGLQYSVSETNWFNGHPRPSLGMLQTDGSYRGFRTFGYDDFKLNCGG